MQTDAERNQSWTRYWASGALHSCAGSFAGNYEGAIAEFWHGVFASLPPGSRVLDVATGNGALPRLLLDSGAKVAGEVEIDAIDLAQVQPRWLRELAPDQRARVRFHSGVRAEALPFADASFQLVISQYGLEYSDLAASTSEVRRVLGADGAVALLLHHCDSLPVRLGREELTHLAWLDAADGVLERARKLVPYMARLGTPAGLASVRADAQAARCRADFNASMRELDARTNAHPGAAAAVLIETQAKLGALLSGSAQLGLTRALAQFEGLIAALRESRLRQTELVACALDQTGVHALAQDLAGTRRLAAQIATIEERSQLFGWTLRMLPED